MQRNLSKKKKTFRVKRTQQQVVFMCSKISHKGGRAGGSNVIVWCEDCIHTQSFRDSRTIGM